MANKTIYVSKKDEAIFEEAQEIAGEALSSVIARALREFVARSKEKQQGMKEVSIRVGTKGLEREQRFIGSQVGEWQGFSDDKEWWLRAKVYMTQKGNWAERKTMNERKMEKIRQLCCHPFACSWWFFVVASSGKYH